MKTIINQGRFLKALTYVSANYFSKPYSLSPMVDRWFNQLAMIEMQNGELLHLSGKLARKYLTISVDGKVITSEERSLIFKFHAKNAEYEKERGQILDKIEDLKSKIDSLEKEKDSLEPIATELATARTELAEQEQLLKAFDADKLKAKELYDAVVARGEAKLDEKMLETDYKSKIKNIMYRPNHGFTHSARAAYMVTAIQAFEQKHEKADESLSNNDRELEKLQMMMLFSVVGRRDETGFNDGSAGRETYELFRVGSGKEYLKYCQQELQEIYHDSLEDIYRDAIIVELMGYSSIEDCLNRRKKPPELFIAYVIAKEQSKGNDISREQALTAIASEQYSLDTLFVHGPIRELANAKLDMMNKAHEIELVRCYPLYPKESGGAKSLGIINNYLIDSTFMGTPETATIESLESAFKMMRCCFDSMAITGQKTTFGLLSQSQFDERKTTILESVKTINARFIPENNEILVKEMEENKEEIGSYFGLSKTESGNLERYRMFLILKETAKQLTQGAPALRSSNQMFHFQHSKNGKPHDANHEQNAISLLHALHEITPVADLSRLPVISSVHHDRLQNKVTVSFDDLQMAEHFLETYALYGDEKPEINKNLQGQFTVEVKRSNYQKIVKEQQVEFKQVTIPSEVSREESLIDDEGNIEALGLVSGSRALVRLVSTTPLSGETFPDYDYLLKALDDPVHERYSHRKEGVNRARYQDPRTGYIYTRGYTAPTDLRFQEPITEPKEFTEQVRDGLTIRQQQSLPVNTIFAKKMAHSLLPHHGKSKPFSGYLNKQSQYFPIGVLSDIKQVNLKNERYVWSRNMTTVQKNWLRERGDLDRKIYLLLGAQEKTVNDPRTGQRIKVLKRDIDQFIIQGEIPKYPNAQKLIEDLQAKVDSIMTVLDKSGYRPTQNVLNDVRMLMKGQMQQHIKQLETFSDSASAIKTCRDIYMRLEERGKQEFARKHPKYAITVEQLIEQQKQSDETENHNEILAANTKGAVRALYATKDELFDRVNLALHAMQIKKNYHYDVPLLVMSEGNPPYHYTEEKIKADLLEAYALLREGKFPYDTTQYPVYKTNSKGKLVIKKDSSGAVLYEPKNLKYQQSVLLDLFKLGLPEVKSIDEIMDGQLNGQQLDGEKIDAAIESIITQMDVLGGLSRETHLMQQIFSEHDASKKEQFFLRAVALGHISLVKDILARDDFVVSATLLEKAITFATAHDFNNINEELFLYAVAHDYQAAAQQIMLIKEKLAPIFPLLAQAVPLAHTPAMKATLGTQVAETVEWAHVKRPMETNEISDYKARIDEILLFFEEINDNQKVFIGLDNNALSNLLLNSQSRTEKNIEHLAAFCNFLSCHPQYIEPYSKILASGNEVKLDQLIEAYHRFSDTPDNEEIVSTAMSLVTQRDWDAANTYMLLREFGAPDIAAAFLKQDKSVVLHSKELNDVIEKQCILLIQQIEKQGMGPNDKETSNYCMLMRSIVENTKENTLYLVMNLQKLQDMHRVVTSLEMNMVREQIERLETKAKSFFTTGNQKKADRIKDAVSLVPLEQRGTVFSDTSNPDGNPVRNALASHRFPAMSPIKSNMVVESKAASSFKKIKTQLEEEKGIDKRDENTKSITP